VVALGRPSMVGEVDAAGHRAPEVGVDDGGWLSFRSPSK
jgi:hypothetical protein